MFDFHLYTTEVNKHLNHMSYDLKNAPIYLKMYVSVIFVCLLFIKLTVYLHDIVSLVTFYEFQEDDNNNNKQLNKTVICFLNITVALKITLH